jgi:hypothetical protein
VKHEQLAKEASALRSLLDDNMKRIKVG